MTKDTLIFYRQWWESIRELEPDEQLQAYDAIMQYVFEGIEPTDKYIRAATSLMRSTINRDREKYDRVCERNRANGAKGGAPKGNANARKSATENNPKQPKTTENNPLGCFEGQPPTPPPEPKPTAAPEMTALEKQFDDFRRAYPGNKRGFRAEFDNFRRKYKNDWRDIIPLLLPAVERLIDWHERARAAGQFTPNYKNLATWLNQQCWTEELPEIKLTPIIQKPNAANAINNGYTPDAAVRQREFAEHIIDKLNRPNAPEPDISGNY